MRTLVTDPPPGAPEDADASGVDVFGDWGMDPDDDDESVELGGEPTEGTFTDADASAAEEDPVAEAPEGDGPSDGDIEGVYEGSSSVSTPDHPRCRKKIFVTFLAYGAMPEITAADTNGCWRPQRLMQEPLGEGSTVKLWRECHYEGDGHTGGSRWFYDATNPSHDSTTELKRVAKCNAAGGSGYVLLEARPPSKPRWRIVNPRGTKVSSFFAELFSSEDVLDDYWLMSSAYRKNKYLRKYKRMAPMINVGYQYGASGMFARARKIRNETLKVCNSIRKGGRIGIYSGKSSPLTGEREAELRFFAVKNAIDACTGIQLTCDQLGGKICESGGNGACAGKGRASSDCDHCCGGVL
ncbi:MAG: hypothetical protein ACXWP4_02720 [Polyangiales bacterium]